MADGYPPISPTETQDILSRILRVTSGMGLSALAVIALAAVRMKLLALQLGPPGLGALTLLVSFLSLASLIVELGIGNSAVREIAAAEGRKDPVERDSLRSALYALAAVLGIFGAAAVALAAHPLATVVLGDDALADEMRLCSIAVLATVWGSAALADLNAFRRIRSLALLQPIAALAATAGTLAVYLADMEVLPVVLVAPPIAVAVTAFLYARALPRIDPRPSPRSLPASCEATCDRGIGVCGECRIGRSRGAGRAPNHRVRTSDASRRENSRLRLPLRATTSDSLSPPSPADYMPLLSEIGAMPARLNRIVNTQLAFAILVALPVIMIVLERHRPSSALFYSAEFGDSTALLRIMLLGETARVAWWTIGYLLVARKRAAVRHRRTALQRRPSRSDGSPGPKLGHRGNRAGLSTCTGCGARERPGTRRPKQRLQDGRRECRPSRSGGRGYRCGLRRCRCRRLGSRLSWAVAAVWAVDAVRRLNQMTGGGLNHAIGQVRGTDQREDDDCVAGLAGRHVAAALLPRSTPSSHSSRRALLSTCRHRGGRRPRAMARRHSRRNGHPPFAAPTQRIGRSWHLGRLFRDSSRSGAVRQPGSSQPQSSQHHGRNRVASGGTGDRLEVLDRIRRVSQRA